MDDSDRSVMSRLFLALVRDKSPLNRVQYLGAMVGSLAAIGFLVFLEQGFLPFCWRLHPGFGSWMGFLLGILVGLLVCALAVVNYVVLRARLRDCREVDDGRLEIEAAVLFVLMFIPVLGGCVVAYLFFAPGYMPSGDRIYHPSQAANG